MSSATKSTAASTHAVGPSKSKPWPASLGLPAPIQWGLLFFCPLLLCGYWLYSKLHSLPAEAWQWTIYTDALVVAVALVPLNWWLESLKWAELLPWAHMPRRIREVLYGTAWSMVGPFRLGAGIGRVAAVKPRERNMALRAFSSSSVSQWWCTITGTAIALFCIGRFLAAAVLLVISGITLALYIGWSPAFWLSLKKSGLVGHWGQSRKIPTVRRMRALSLSIFRYFVMLAQFVLVLNAFGHLHAWPDNAGKLYIQGQGAALTWGLTSLAPMPAFGDLGFREAAALLVLDSPTSIDTTAVVAAMLTLWVINLFIPSIVGLIWHARHQSKRKSRKAKLGM